MDTLRNWGAYKPAWMTCWLILSSALSGCQSQGYVRQPEMPECLKEPIPSESMLMSLTQAMVAFETGSLDSLPPVPVMGAEQMRLCLLRTREAWPR